MPTLKSLKKAVTTGITVLFCSAPAQAAVSWTTWANINGTEAAANAEHHTLNVGEYLNGLSSALGGSPRHPIDNNGVHDFILLEFQMPITLTELKTGWIGKNNNMTVMAFTGTSFTRSDRIDSNASLSTNSQTTRSLTSADWGLISNSQNLQADTLSSTSNTININSSYWLAGSYNYYFSRPDL